MPAGANKKVVVAVSQYPGGAEALLPVLQRIGGEGKHRLRVFASSFAADIFQKAGLPFIRLSDGAPQRCEILMDESSPALLITDLVGKEPDDLHYVFSRMAKRRNIPVLGILDSWMNYPDRFQDPLAAAPMGLFPDKLAIMNDFARRELEELGVPRSRMVVTGQPAFDKTYHLARRRDEARRRVRTALHVPTGRRLVVFFSEDTEEAYGRDRSSANYLGFTQNTVIDTVLAALGTLGPDVARFIIKRHPRERTPFPVVVAHGEPVLQLGADCGIAPLDLVLAADVNIGMSTIMLFHSYLSRKPTLVAVPGILPGKDLSVLTRAGVLKRLATAEQVCTELRAALSDEDYFTHSVMKEEWYKNDGKAAARVVSALNSMLA